MPGETWTASPRGTRDGAGTFPCQEGLGLGQQSCPLMTTIPGLGLGGTQNILELIHVKLWSASAHELQRVPVWPAQWRHPTRTSVSHPGHRLGLGGQRSLWAPSSLLWTRGSQHTPSAQDDLWMYSQPLLQALFPTASPPWSRVRGSCADPGMLIPGPGTPRMHTLRVPAQRLRARQQSRDWRAPAGARGAVTAWGLCTAPGARERGPKQELSPRSPGGSEP